MTHEPLIRSTGSPVADKKNQASVYTWNRHELYSIYKPPVKNTNIFIVAWVASSQRYWRPRTGNETRLLYFLICIQDESGSSFFVAVPQTLIASAGIQVNQKLSHHISMQPKEPMHSTVIDSVDKQTDKQTNKQSHSLCTYNFSFRAMTTSSDGIVQTFRRTHYSNRTWHSNLIWKSWSLCRYILQPETNL